MHDFIKPNVEEGSFMPLVLIYTGIVKYLWQILILYSNTICVPYIFRKSIFGWNCDHGTPLCDTPLLEDTPLCDTPDELQTYFVECWSYRGSEYDVDYRNPELCST